MILEYELHFFIPYDEPTAVKRKRKNKDLFKRKAFGVYNELYGISSKSFSEIKKNSQPRFSFL